MAYSDLDTDKLPFLSELISEFGTVVEEQGPAGEATVTRVAISTFIELDLETDAQGRLEVRGSTPTQRTETTVLPVFHQLKLTIGLD